MESRLSPKRDATEFWTLQTHLLLGSIKPPSRHVSFYRARKKNIRRTIRDDPHASILYSSMSVIVTSSKLLAERINDLALRFGATRSHVYQIGDIEMISAFENSRTANHDIDDRQLRIDQLVA